MTSPEATYDELLERADAPAGSTWHLIGDRPEVGTIGLLRPEHVLAAATLIRRGLCFNLDLELDAFDPPLAKNRLASEHVMISANRDHRDDYLERMYLQASTQIDGLRHFRHWEHGFYNGTPDQEVVSGKPALGIQLWAERPIVGRGVLIDIERHFARHPGGDYRPDTASSFTVTDLERAAEEQGTELRHGDVVLIRTGWLRWARSLSPSGLAELRANMRSPGLLQSEDSVRWLWDHRVAMLASDNFAVEVLPAVPESPFLTHEEQAGDNVFGHHRGLMHRVLIPLLGLALGEMWDLDGLAQDCEEHGTWDFMVIAKPLNVLGGVGSPANAVAIR